MGRGQRLMSCAGCLFWLKLSGLPRPRVEPVKTRLTPGFSLSRIRGFGRVFFCREILVSHGIITLPV